jgi:hypothetical protein
MTTSEWHVGADLWAAYANGHLDPVAESSVEAHAVGCERCRAAAQGQVDSTELAPLWEGISLQVQRPRPPLPLRWLRRAGVADSDTVVVGAGDGIALPWAVAVGAAFVCAMLAGFAPTRYQDVWFLLLAPMIPVLAVVAAYDATDPLREVAAATPYSKLQMALLRTAFALAVALPVTAAIGLLLPGLESLAFVWLLPGLVLTCLGLVLLTWLSPWRSGALVAGAWGATVTAIARFDDVTVLASASAQLLFAVGAALMGAVLILRTTVLDLRGGAS